MNKIFGNVYIKFLSVVFTAFLGTFFFLQTAHATILFENPGEGDLATLVIYNEVEVVEGGTVTDETPVTFRVSDGDGTEVVTSTTAGSQNFLFVTPGKYTVVEEALPGYHVTYGEGDGDGCASDGTLDIESGLSCTVRQVPGELVEPFVQTTTTLHINEVVINDDSDTKTVADFPFDVSVDGVTTTYSGAASTTIFNLSATSTYRVDLTVPSNYSKTLSGDCSTVTGDVQNESVSDTITKLCTITLDDQALVLSDVSAEVLGSNSVKLTWNSNHLATTRVVYDTVAHATTSTAPLYGYAFTTNEDSTYSLHHAVTIIGLTAGTTYFFRAVSHGSPEVASGEVSAATAASTGGGGNFAAGPGNGGGAVAPATPVAPPQAVLGVKLEDPVIVPAPIAPQAVLGFKTLPVTGGDSAVSAWYVLSVVLVGFGSVLVVRGRGEE